MVAPRLPEHRTAHSLLALALASTALWACGADGTEPPPADAGVADGGAGGGDAGPSDAGSSDGGAPFEGRYLTRLETPADLAQVSAPGNEGVKFLLNVEGRARVAPLLEDCYFQNMRHFEWHLQFLQSFEELRDISYTAYLERVMRAPSRVWWGGSIKAWPGAAHPGTGRLGVVGYTVYAEPNQLGAAGIIEVDATLRRCVPFASALLAFIPTSPDQKALAQIERGRLEEAGVTVIPPEALIDGLSHQVYSPGEGYGTLRIVPRGQALREYGPRDIVVVESAPTDISLVQGLITKDPQSPLSHVSLRLREKGLPNLAVPRIYEAGYLAALENSLVHLVATEERFVLEPARLEDAEAFWESRRPQIPPVRADLERTALLRFEAMRNPDGIGYGVKAANLGELWPLMPEQHRLDGFGIPFSAYARFMTERNLTAEVESLLADPQVRQDAAHKRRRLKQLRDRIRGARLLPDFREALYARLVEVFGGAAHTERTRFRSSTNVEDLDELTGAGLYDSRSGCLGDDLDDDDRGPSRCLSAEEEAVLRARLAERRAELAAHPERSVYLVPIIEDIEGDLANEKTVERAVLRVWASLWNERAFDEREYYGIDHRAAYMGMAVHPTFVLEQANAVAFTHFAIDDGDPLYRLGSQYGEESVVRPDDPTAVAEHLTFRRRGEPPEVADVRVLVHSSLLPAGATVWTEAELEVIGGLLFTIHDHFSTQVYGHMPNVNLDVELEHHRDGRILPKQVRPLISRDP